MDSTDTNAVDGFLKNWITYLRLGFLLQVKATDRLLRLSC